jgi:deazaflavin-dependent oxidoreductase (nitroreductase family)
MSESSSWPAGFDNEPRLTLSTVGRKTGRTHKVTINFVAQDGRIFVVSSRKNRDWVKNALKNPAVPVTIKGATRTMNAVPVSYEEAHDNVEALYKKKFRVGARLYYNWRDKDRTQIFELKPSQATP